MRQLIFLIITFCVVFEGRAQWTSDSIKKSIQLDEIVVSANKTEEMKRKVAYQILVLNIKQIQFSNPQTTADILSNTGQILVQKSQQGGGSPIIRGFEASRVLMVIDGVRMNNLIYRGGHLQNIITIDPSILDRVEVLFGSSSTIYGSDALGGTLHFRTRTPQLYSGKGNPLSVNFMQRYSTVNQGLSTHVNFNLGFKKCASLTALSFNAFGDLRMGKNKNPFYDTLFGLRNQYAAHIDGKDSTVVNQNPYVQAISAYKQMDVLQKFLYKPNAYADHQINIQFSNSSNIPRYDRLTEMRNGKPRFAEWYYGPQTRVLTAYDFTLKNKLGFNLIHLGLSGQKIEESRVSRNFGNEKLDTRIERVGVLGYNLDFQKNIRGNHKLRFGFDGQANTLKSTAFSLNIRTNKDSSISTRYPDGRNTLVHQAIYYTHTFLVNKKFTINDGGRLGRSVLKSEVVNNSFFHLPVTEVEQRNTVYSGYIGAIYNPIERLKLSLLSSTGFRVPNIDDLSKIFDNTSGYVMVPNPNLKPEQTWSNELGISFKPIETIRIEASVWYTYFYNAITTSPSTLNGQDSVFYNDDKVKSKVYSNKNSKEASIKGASLSVVGNLIQDGQIYGNLNYTEGYVKNQGNKQPLDHISPLTCNLGYLHTYGKFSGEFFLLFNGKKPIDKYSNSGEDNQNYAPKGGMPAWMTLNLRLGYRANAMFAVQGGIENILDTNYRVFASGINGPGRNIYLSARIAL